jgi:hypothetical protein
MGGVTILYEMKRIDKFSVFIIGLLLISIYGLICINENNTYYIYCYCLYFIFYDYALLFDKL